MVTFGLPLSLDGVWADYTWDLGSVKLNASTEIYLDLNWEGSVPVQLRLCFIQTGEDRREFHYWREYKIGRSVVVFRLSNFPDFRPEDGDIVVEHLYFGGTGQGTVKAALAVFDSQKLLFSAA